MAKIKVKESEVTILSINENDYISLTDFKPTEFDRFKMEAGLNAFTLSPQKWTTSTGAIGIVTRAGRYGGTYAHKDIAFKFASWISVEFELYMVKEFQRLKEHEQSQLGWSAKRELAKINYHIHTSAVSRNDCQSRSGRNIRDYATINELICLSNMESMNSVLIKDGISQPDRLARLNEMAIHQMEILTNNSRRHLLK